MSQRLPVVCLSLGGTKIQIGALPHAGECLHTPELLWRTEPDFAEALNHGDAADFCSALIARVRGFLESHGYALSDVGVLGVAFPGPNNGQGWHSNNLTPPFARPAGVPLEDELIRAMHGLETALPQVRVALDAQCDAAGELRHPNGCLKDTQPTGSATVLNIATGIAAGFIRDNRVLSSDREFASIDGRYDSGAGHLGRHLWRYSEAGGSRWEYHFQPRGGQIDPPPGAVRFTDCLSGPALAARLLLALMESQDPTESPDWAGEEFGPVETRRHREVLQQLHETSGIRGAGQYMRGEAKGLAKAVLEWADRVYANDRSSKWSTAVTEFARTIASELGGALSTWLAAPGWLPFGRHVVLTGGVGIHFLKQSAGDSERGFLQLLSRHVPSSVRLHRSKLSSAVERECYNFID